MQRSTVLFAHVIEIDGQLVGGWRRVVKARSVGVETTYLANVTASERKAVETQIARYRSYSGAHARSAGDTFGAVNRRTEGRPFPDRGP
jgi:hypothetical protein